VRSAKSEVRKKAEVRSSKSEKGPKIEVLMRSLARGGTRRWRGEDARDQGAAAGFIPAVAGTRVVAVFRVLLGFSVSGFGFMGLNQATTSGNPKVSVAPA
jgi:hypothetical protein